MGWVDHEYWSGDGELTPRYIGSKRSGINRYGLSIGKYKCICGCELYVGKGIVKLYHPSGGGELECPDCLTIAQSMSGLGNNTRKSIRDIIRSKLSICEVR